jgi:class 3 adenylate cyclase
VAGLAAGLLAWALPATQRLATPLFDAAVALVRAVAPAPAPALVLVGLDETTLAQSPRPLGLLHEELGTALAAIAAAGPRATVLDIVLPSRAAGPGLEALDLALMQGLAAARSRGGLVLALEPDAAGRIQPLHPPYAAAAGPATAVALYPLDWDHAVRRFEPQIGGQTTLIARLAERLGVPARAGWIDWTRGAPHDYLPLQQVLDWARQGDEAALRAAFAGKLVFVGSVLPFVDRLPQPVALAAWEPGLSTPPGVLVHMQAARSLLGHGFIAPLAWPVALLLLLGGAAFGLIEHPLRRWTWLAAALVASFLGMAALLRAGWILPLVPAWAAALVAATTRSVLEAREHRREQRRLARTFGGYVSPQVLEAILAGRLAASGGRRAMAFLFADLRGFTALSEREAPEVVLDLLNRYYATITPVIHAHGGTIDNFRGDGVMVMFGAPEPLPQPERAALAAAQAVLAAVALLNRQLQAEGRAPLQCAIGVAAGVAVFGDLGSAERKDYTALGDAVNVAARLQDVAREGSHDLVATAEVLERAGLPSASWLALGELPLRGHSPVALLAWQGARA